MAEQLLTKLRTLNREHSQYMDKCMGKVAELVREQCIRAARQGERETELEAKEIAGKLNRRDISDQDLRQFAHRLEAMDEFKNIGFGAVIMNTSVPTLRKRKVTPTRKLTIKWS